MHYLSRHPIPALGYFPTHFPRDPIVVNTFPEQLALGQVLQPMFRIARNGEITAGVAQSWTTSQDRRKLNISLSTSTRFSSGMSVKAKDVAYSLRRHLQSTTSQSKAFLQDIDTIEVINDQKLTINLKRPNNSLLQAFSRDQLGILPNDWTFNPDSEEPLIGSGPYRLIRREDHWYFIWNEYYPQPPGDRPVEWKSLQTGDTTKPAYLPFVSQTATKKLATQLSLQENDFKPQSSYVQCSYWWLQPKGESEGDGGRLKIMSAIQELIGSSIRRLEADAATGIVPSGIPGALKDRPIFENAPTEAKTTKSAIRIAIPQHILAEHKHRDDIETDKKKTGYQIEFHTYDVANFEQEMIRIKPHVLVLRFAGAFKDPVGFLGIVGKLLGQPLDDYAQIKGLKLQDILEAESTKMKIAKAEAYSQALVRNGYYIPGWKTPIYSYLAEGFKYKENPDRFIPSLEDVTFDDSGDQTEPT